MYTIYRTEGFVVNGIPVGESDRLVSIFTEELGLVRASIQSARSLASRHRLHLQDLSFSQFGLVRGKHAWRLTNAVEIFPATPHFRSHENQGAGKFLARLAWLLERFIHGEERNNYLFATIRHAVEYVHHEKVAKKGSGTFLDASKNVPDPFLALEWLVVLRILHAEGMVQERPALDPLLASSEITEEFLLQARAARGSIVSEINRVLQESQL